MLSTNEELLCSPPEDDFSQDRSHESSHTTPGRKRESAPPVWMEPFPHKHRGGLAMPVKGNSSLQVSLWPLPSYASTAGQHGGPARSQATVTLASIPGIPAAGRNLLPAEGGQVQLLHKAEPQHIPAWASLRKGTISCCSSSKNPS